MILFPNFTGTEQAAEYVWDTLRWPLRESSALCPNPLPKDYHGLCLGFDLGVATQYAHNFNIPEMVQAIFYAMVLNDAVELGLSCRIDAQRMAKTKFTPRIKTPDELLAEGTTEGNFYSALGSQRLGAEVLSTSSSSSSVGTSASSSSDGASISSSSDGSSASSSSDEASTSSSK
ncbi:hypothetical protein Cgig2_015862 [Carnegiea gigantea]|uniref:Uncharacterized protein n=1 Tax=Carnegiea gigantea TaxID=171969 RepID=A0A9Q1JMY4_9CARY|nr:hypothetical protein Cgig2_015862 [Carnegiea gigantea]